MRRTISRKFRQTVLRCPYQRFLYPLITVFQVDSPRVGLCSGPRQMCIALEAWRGGIGIVEMEINVQFQH
jgi:hypothetical protein